MNILELWFRRRSSPWFWASLALMLWATYALLALSERTAWWVPSWLHGVLALPGDNASTLMSRGQFGDAFGAFNALVSTLALVALLTTLGVQQKQLAAQQTQTRSEVRLMRQQQFQEQYFRAVDAYRVLLSEFQPLQLRGRHDEGPGRRGRSAMFVVWREYLLDPLAGCNGRLGDVVRQQLAASLERTPDSQEAGDNARLQISRLVSAMSSDRALREEVVGEISLRWSHLYSTHRFQLDALFRAWYTVYRILDTAPMYELEVEAVRLYGASFRAQLSWIELAFLLANQSGLNPRARFPKACSLSNTYVVFDNLVDDDDLVIACLSAIARAREADGNTAELTRSAFGARV